MVRATPTAKMKKLIKIQPYWWVLIGRNTVSMYVSIYYNCCLYIFLITIKKVFFYTDKTTLKVFTMDNVFTVNNVFTVYNVFTVDNVFTVGSQNIWIQPAAGKLCFGSSFYIFCTGDCQVDPNSNIARNCIFVKK